MLEKIPGYNQAPKSLHQITSGADLAPVVINPSLLLYRLEVFVYLFMLLAASVAIFPFVFTAFYWLFLWLAFLLMIIAAIRASSHAKNANVVSFSVAKQVWHLQTNKSDLIVRPYGDVVVWGKVIILSVREIESGRKRQIVALPDSMTADDWRQLRVWLRMELRKSS